MTSPLYDVIIIGAGASGLVCALECARARRKTLVLEKEPQPARKILASGNGRCNLTNAYVAPAYYHAPAELIAKTLDKFSFRHCLDYFSRLGVLTTEEELGRVFPSGKTFTVTTADGRSFQAKKLVLACGSCAYPQIGGTQSGYELARALGHTLITPRPALSALCIKETSLARLTGVRCQVRLEARQNDTRLDQAEGEVLFTHYGLNGPAALNISSAVSRALTKGNVALTMNFFPQLPNPQAFLEQRLKAYATRRPKDFLAGILHESVSNLLID